MAIILSIETSASVCSAALHDNGRLIAVRELHTPQTAASRLAVQIEELFAEANTPKSRLDAVAVSTGPGSYTGLRIGVATAKGICYGLNLPFISIDSLLVLASHVNVPSMSALLCPMIDARRMEVYCCLLDTSLHVMEATHAKIIDENSFMDHLLHQSILFFGDGAAKCHAVIRHPNAEFLESLYATAANMGQLAFQKFQTREFENLEIVEPNYLKEFVAKTKSPQSLF